MVTEQELQEAIKHVTCILKCSEKAREVAVEKIIYPISELHYLNRVQQERIERNVGNFFLPFGINSFGNEVHRLGLTRDHPMLFTFNLYGFFLKIYMKDVTVIERVDFVDHQIFDIPSINEYFIAWKTKILELINKTKNELEISGDEFVKLAEACGDEADLQHLKQYYLEMSAVHIYDIEKHQLIMNKYANGFTAQLILEANGRCNYIVSGARVIITRVAKDMEGYDEDAARLIAVIIERRNKTPVFNPTPEVELQEELRSMQIKTVRMELKC